MELLTYGILAIIVLIGAVAIYNIINSDDDTPAPKQAEAKTKTAVKKPRKPRAKKTPIKKVK